MSGAFHQGWKVSFSILPEVAADMGVDRKNDFCKCPWPDELRDDMSNLLGQGRVILGACLDHQRNVGGKERRAGSQP